MGSAKDAAVKAYIRSPKIIRKYGDPLVRNRAKTQESFQKRSEKGRKTVKAGIKKLLMGTKKAMKKI